MHQNTFALKVNVLFIWCLEMIGSSFAELKLTIVALFLELVNAAPDYGGVGPTGQGKCVPLILLFPLPLHQHII